MLREPMVSVTIVLADMSGSVADPTAEDRYELETMPAEHGSPPEHGPSSIEHTAEGIKSCNIGGITKPKRQITGFRWLLICIAIFSGNILYGLDTTIAADIQASVSETFRNVTQLGWLGVGFNLGSTVTVLPLGKAYARFDNKWVFITCLAMFAAGSALCGAAPSMRAMIVGRVWAGAGGAGVYLGLDFQSVLLSLKADSENSTLNLVTLMNNSKQQPFYVGMTGFVYGSGCILGPIVGGSLADSPATWRWVSYLSSLS